MIKDVRPVLLDVGTVAKLLSVSPKTIYGWIREDRIKSVRLPGGGVRIPTAAVEDILGMETGEIWLSLNTKGEEDV